MRVEAYRWGTNIPRARWTFDDLAEAHRKADEATDEAVRDAYERVAVMIARRLGTSEVRR